MYDNTLRFFSIGCTIVFAAWIVIPYLRRQHDLVSARTFFLAGAILYVGLSGVNSATNPHYYDYGPGVYQRYFAGIIVFFLAFYWGNTRFKWPERWASKQFRNWPPLEGLGIMLPVIISVMIMGTQVATRNIHSLAVLTSRATIIAPVFALTFALFAWFRAKYNPVSIIGVIGAFALGGYIAFSLGGGRRPLYAMLITVPCCAYWWHFRYQSPKKVLALVLASLVLVPVVDSAYRAARWYGVNTSKKLDASEGAKIRWGIFRDSLFGGDSTLGESTLKIGHNAAENSLVVIHMVTEAKGEFPEFQTRAFDSLYVSATLWIPRSLWENKPVSLGVSLPFDSRVLAKTVKSNWGPGIVGHGYHDGGLLVLLVYGLLAGCGIRYFDELLRNNPNNPYMIAFIAAASVQITGWIRGDISTMVPLTFLCLAMLFMLRLITQMVLGVESPWRQASFAPVPAGGPQS